VGRFLDKWWPVLAVALIFGLAGLGHLAETKAADGELANVGQAVSTGYKFDRQTVVFRDDIAVVDTAATTLSDVNLALTPRFDVEGRVNVPVSARFSTAAATVKVRWVAGWYDGTTFYMTNMSPEITFTAPAAGLQRNSLYTPASYVFDSYGGRVGYLVVTDAPSAGTVDFWVGSY
jgi:hypothetical protein